EPPSPDTGDFPAAQPGRQGPAIDLLLLAAERGLDATRPPLLPQWGFPSDAGSQPVLRSPAAMPFMVSSRARCSAASGGPSASRTRLSRDTWRSWMGAR